MSDIGDEKVSDEWRDELFEIVIQTPRLDWMLLTKEPENLHRYLQSLAARKRMSLDCLMDGPLRHAWVGVSAENQEMWDRRTEALGEIPAHVTFVSCEPLLGRISIKEIGLTSIAPSWIITGGESGYGARPCEEAWQHEIAQDAKGLGISVYQKQLGSHGRSRRQDPKGEKASSWQVFPTRQHPETGLEIDPATGQDNSAREPEEGKLL